jgi:hypothetical protein
MSTGRTAVHLVLDYDSITSSLSSEIYFHNMPNSLTADPQKINGIYRYYAHVKKTKHLLLEIHGTDRTSINIRKPTESYYRFSVEVVYTANDIVQPPLKSDIVVNTKYVFGSYLHKNHPSSGFISLYHPIDIIPVDIVWSFNYEPVSPQQTDPFCLTCISNGIYEVSFRDRKRDTTFYSTIEYIGSDTDNDIEYLKLVGSDGRLYGSNGIPFVKGVKRDDPPFIKYFEIVPCGMKQYLDSQIIHRNYVNGVLCETSKCNGGKILLTEPHIKPDLSAYLTRFDIFLVISTNKTITANTFLSPCKQLDLHTKISRRKTTV